MAPCFPRSAPQRSLLFSSLETTRPFFAFKQSSCIFASHLTKKKSILENVKSGCLMSSSHEDHRPNVVAWKVKGTVIVNGIVLSLALAPRPQDGHTHVEARSSPSSSSHRRNHPHNSNCQKVPVIDIFYLDLYVPMHEHQHDHHFHIMGTAAQLGKKRMVVRWVRDG